MIWGLKQILQHEEILSCLYDFTDNFTEYVNFMGGTLLAVVFSKIM